MSLTPEQKAEGWIEWSGGDVCPIKDDRTSFAFFNRLGGCAAEGGNARSLDWSHKDSSWDIIAYRIIEAHGADAEPARPTPFPASYDDLVFDPITGWSQTVVVDGERPEWLRDDDRCCESIRRASFRWRGSSRFSDVLAIRVRRREPKRETVECCLQTHRDGLFIKSCHGTIDLIDGKPDLSTLKIVEDAL